MPLPDKEVASNSQYAFQDFGGCRVCKLHSRFLSACGQDQQKHGFLFDNLPSKTCRHKLLLNVLLKGSFCVLTVADMLGRNGFVEFSPLLSMAHLCEFATSCTPTEISSRRSNGTRAPSSSNGTSQVRCRIPASLGKRSRRESKLCRPVQAPCQEKSDSASSFSSKSNAFINEERSSKRRNSVSHRDLCGVTPSCSTTPFQPFKACLSDEHPWELHLPWELDDDITFSPTMSQGREQFSFFHEVDSSSKLHHVKEDGDQQRYTRQPSTNVHLLESKSEPSGVEVIEPDKALSNSLAAAALPVPGTAPHWTESANRMSVDELRLFPSSAELASAATSRSMDALVAWYQRLRELIEFERLYGHQNVPQKSDSFPKLGTWVNKQRYHRHDLPSEKVAVLEAVCFDWGEKLGETRWRMRYNALVAYRAKNGDCKCWCDAMTN